MQTVKVILQNTSTQLKAQRDAAYNAAKAKSLEALKSTLADYTNEQTQKYNEAVAALKEALTKAIDTKTQEINLQAETEAAVSVATFDSTLADIQKMIDAQVSEEAGE